MVAAGRASLVGGTFPVVSGKGMCGVPGLADEGFVCVKGN